VAPSTSKNAGRGDAFDLRRFTRVPRDGEGNERDRTALASFSAEVDEVACRMIVRRLLTRRVQTLTTLGSGYGSGSQQRRRREDVLPDATASVSP
jgi:hypothetical protein